MNRSEIVEIMKDVYTSSEAAEYLNISNQRLNQLVHDKRIEPIKANNSIMLFLKSDLDKCKVSNVFNVAVNEQVNQFNINVPYVRDAILYYTIQQYFNNNDKRTCEFINQIKVFKNFNFRSGLQVNIPLLAGALNVTDQDFYNNYQKVKLSFLTLTLTDDVILVQKGDGILA